MAVTGRKPQRTWSRLGDVKRKPNTYEVVTSDFHYHFRRETGPAPFELDTNDPLNKWYLQYREASPFQVDDWEQFRDPHKLTYKDYVNLQKDRETYLDGLIDKHETVDTVSQLDAQWISTLRQLFIPLRFPLHVLQMSGLYVGQMAPSSFITNCAHFQAADELRRIQRIAYWTKVLANGHGEDLAETATARDAWEQDASWQPLRKVLEELLVAWDWGEAFAALNLAVKPAIDTLLNWQLADLAQKNGDDFLMHLFTEFQLESARSRDWTHALVAYALDREPDKLTPVLREWVGSWWPRTLEGVAPLAQLFEQAPESPAADDVVSAVEQDHAQHRAACGL